MIICRIMKLSQQVRCGLRALSLCLLLLSFSVRATDAFAPDTPTQPTSGRASAYPNPFAPSPTWAKIQQTVYPNVLAQHKNLPVANNTQAPHDPSNAMIIGLSAQDNLTGDSVISATSASFATAPIVTTAATQPVLLAQQSAQTASYRKTIYFTFDDGPSVGWTGKVLEILRRYHAQATFFMIGANVARNPKLVQTVIKAGNTVGNHTYDHKSFRKMTHKLFDQEVQATQKALGDVGTNCLRPPYGATDASTASYAKALGFRLVLWNVDPRDWTRPGATVIAQRILARVYPGAIVLMHDGGGDRSQTVAALEVVLHKLSAQGYHFEAYCTH
jgi:peptidoglycan-N-acetylglucosamine deacetylase